MAETKKTTDQLDDSKDKLKAIESTISSIEKQFGKGSIMRDRKSTRLNSSHQ